MKNNSTDLEVGKKLHKTLPKYSFSVVLLCLLLHFLLPMAEHLMLINVLSAVLAFVTLRTWGIAFASGFKSVCFVFFITLFCRAAILGCLLLGSTGAEKKIAVLMVTGYLFYETLLVFMALQQKDNPLAEKVNLDA